MSIAAARVEALPRLLTADELSAQLGLSRPRLYQLARQGDIPHLRLGRAVRFSPTAVAEWISAGGTETGTAP